MTPKTRWEVPLKYRQLVGAIAISNGVTLMLFVSRAADAQNFRYWFLIWNLFLAWLPVLFAVWLTRHLATHRWLHPGSLVLSILWLGFLPNSFYLVSDLIHLQSTPDVNLLYDAVMFSSFIFNGYIAGLASMYFVHRELVRRVSLTRAHSLMAGVIVLCGFAIYMGRVLRWNTWDALVNPFGVIFDISERFINPLIHLQSYVTTLTFSLLIGSLYLIAWEVGKLLLPLHKPRRQAKKVPAKTSSPRKKRPAKASP